MEEDRKGWRGAWAGRDDEMHEEDREWIGDIGEV